MHRVRHQGTVRPCGGGVLMPRRRTLLFRLVPLDPCGTPLEGDVVAALSPYTPRPELVRRVGGDCLSCTCSTYWRTGRCPHITIARAELAHAAGTQDIPTTNQGETP